MEKRPLSLTIIAWLLVVFALFGLYGVFTMGSNPIAMKMLEQMHVSLMFQQAWGTVNCIITLICAYGIFKGQPWSRVLYVGWGILGIIVSFFISPMKAVIVLSLIILIVVAAFLFSAKGNEWFAARGLALTREQG
jgi:uncharacterized membrane protein affecting hemolysin expression